MVSSTIVQHVSESRAKLRVGGINSVRMLTFLEQHPFKLVGVATSGARSRLRTGKQRLTHRREATLDVQRKRDRRRVRRVDGGAQLHGRRGPSRGSSRQRPTCPFLTPRQRAIPRVPSRRTRPGRSLASARLGR
ncbi:unnamed protein product [Ixodes persulcatus]